MTVADRIKESRERLGLTQEELANKMGYASKSAVSRTENAGDNIGNKRIKEFSKALNVTVAYLMGWDDSPNNEMVSVLEKGIEQYPEDKTLQYLHRGLRIDSVTKNITEDELQLVEAYRTLDDESKRQLVLMLAFLKDQNNKQ